MGWWRSGDSVIGDGPADTLMQALEDAVAERDGRKPTLQELVDATAAALGGSPGERAEPTVTVQSEPESRTVHGRAGAADERLAAVLRAGFDAVGAEYRESELNREPTPTELLESLAFILRPSPERYLADGENLRLLAIVPA